MMFDDPADRVGAVEPALRSAHDLDAVDIPSQDMLEIEGAGRRIGRVDAVDKDLGLVRVGAADEDRGHSPGPAGLHDIETRHVLQRIRQCALLLALDFLAGDDGDAAAYLAFRCRQAGRGNDHGRQGNWLG